MPTGTNDAPCHWRCLIGTRWVWDNDYPPGDPCPAEEKCCPPTHAGASGDKETTGCLPLGSC